MRTVIVGAGNFGRELAGWFDFGIAGYIDDVASGEGLPHPFIGTIQEYIPAGGDLCVMAISDPAGKRKVAELLTSKGARFSSMIHRSAVISTRVSLGEGIVVGPFTSISSGAKLGDFVTLNAFSGPGHDTVVGDYATFAAHVNVCGWCKIGAGAYLASSCVVLPGVEVGAGAIVGAGAVVARESPPGATAYGPFAKILIKPAR